MTAITSADRVAGKYYFFLFEFRMLFKKEYTDDQIKQAIDELVIEGKLEKLYYRENVPVWKLVDRK